MPLDQQACAADGGCPADAGAQPPLDRRDAAPAPDAAPSAPPDAAAGAEACAAIDCGAHGSCRQQGGEARCVCEEGFAGDRCEVCERGLGLDPAGACVPACEGDDAPDCGAHGQCVAADDGARCECEAPYAGDRCETCAEGFRLEGEACVADCGECGAHAYCDESLQVPACTCVAGYRDDGAGCSWVGAEAGAGIADEELDGDGVWTTRHVELAGGKARFVNTTVDGQCELGSLAQSFEMPAPDLAGPLALELVVTTSCAGADADECPALQVEIGDSVSRVPVPGGGTASRTVRRCLGDAAYGGSVELVVRPGLGRNAPIDTPAAFSCESDSWPEVQAVRVRPAPECPRQAAIPNGEFDDSTGWSLQNASIAGGVLALQPDGRAEVEVVFPSPRDVPSPALRLEPAAGSLSVFLSLDGLQWARGVSAAGGPVVVCLPAWAHATGHSLELAALAASELEGLSIETDSRCGDGSFDAGFERAFADGPAGNGFWYDTGRGSFHTVSDSAHGGERAARTTALAARLRAVTRVPQPADGSGPAFVVWHRVTLPMAEGQLHVTPFGFADVTVETEAWSQDVVCLDRAWHGQLAAVGLRALLAMHAPDDPGSPNEPSLMEIDDAGFALSARCP